jgi:membrane fusion protein, multidrug efflux system
VFMPLTCAGFSCKRGFVFWNRLLRCCQVIAVGGLGLASAEADEAPPAWPFLQVPQEWIHRNIEQKVVNLEGWLEPYEQVSLYARVNGYLKVIYIDVGDRIKKGDVLVKLDAPELEAEYRMAEAHLAEAKSRLKQAEMVYKFKVRIANRIHNLREKTPGAITADEMDIADGEKVQAEGELLIRKVAVQVAQAKFENLSALLSFTEVVAPFDGVVTKRLMHTGSLVEAGSVGGEPLVELARVDRLRLVVRTPERVAPYIQRGDTLQARFPALPGKVFDGKVSRIAALVSIDANHDMRVEADVKLQAGLHPGLRGIVSVRLW